MYEHKIEVAGQQVTVHELTVKEHRAWLMDIMTRAKDQSLEIELYSVDRDLFDDMPLTDLPRFTDLTPEQIDAMRPSDLRKVIEAVKEVNPDFFGMWGRMRTSARAIVESIDKSFSGLNGQPAPSSSTATTMSGPTH